MQIEDKRFKHGCAKRNSSTRLYRVWQNMRTRCNNSHSKEYKYYGQRGISVNPQLPVPVSIFYYMR